MKLSYAGDVSVQTCWEKLRKEASAQLVDVRTRVEWIFVGVPVLESLEKQVIFSEWQRFPDMRVNEEFCDQVIAHLARNNADYDSSIFMICRSGVRSMASADALTARGYKYVFNVLGGFEGDTDENGHRATREGWKFEQLPWRQ